jgi:hypothetical protein
VRSPRSFIVRIYRRGFGSLSGIVEDSSSGEQRSFKSMAELWAVFLARSRRPSCASSAPVRQPDKTDDGG